MAKTIEQLADQANIIQTAVRQGENTAERVGGLFTDIVDYLSNYKASEVKLGPLLTSLNDPRLVNPGDGQTLSFSIMKDGWTFDDALTELRISDRKIEETVTSNYRLFLETKDEFAEDMRGITDDLNAKYADFSSYRIQTDQYIDQWCVAYDEYGNKVAVSRIYQTSEEIQSMVTDNKEAADIAFTKLFTLTGLDYDDPSQAYSASWLWQKKDGIYGAAASFDANGNILQSSQLQVTVGGIQTQVTDNKKAADNAFNNLDTVVIPGITGRLDDVEEESENSATWISQNKNKISLVAANFDAEGHPTVASGIVVTSTFAGLFASELGSSDSKATIAAYIKDGISIAEIKADQVDFHFTQDTSFYANGTEVMNLDTGGNLWIKGEYRSGSITGEISIGTGTNKMFIRPNASGGANLVGLRGNTEVINLGFEEAGAQTASFGILKLGEYGDYLTEIHSHFLRISQGNSNTSLKASLWDNELIFSQGGGALGITFGSRGTKSGGTNKRLIVIRTLSIDQWPTRSEANVGEVFLGDDEILRVRMS